MPSHESRHRVVTPSCAACKSSGCSGSQRAPKTIEDFTSSSEAGAYFDGDHVIAAKKGHDRSIGSPGQPDGGIPGGTGLPAARKLDVFGRLDPSKATPAELRGQEIFFARAGC